MRLHFRQVYVCTPGVSTDQSPVITKTTGFRPPNCRMQRLREIDVSEATWEDRGRWGVVRIARRAAEHRPDTTALRWRVAAKRAYPTKPCFSRYSSRITVACCGVVPVASIVNSGALG